MKRLLLTNNGYPTEKNPKHASYIKNIHRGLELAGLDVELCVLDSNKWTPKHKKWLAHLEFFKNLRAIKDYSVYDFVLMNHYAHHAPPLISRLKEMKQPVLHWHGEDLYPPSKRKRQLYDWFYSKLPAHTKHITPSNYFKECVHEELGYSRDLIFVSPSGGVNIDTFKPLEDPKPNDKIRVGFASAMNEEKGADMVLRFLDRKSEIERKTGKTVEFHYIFYGRDKIHWSIRWDQHPDVIRHDVIPTDQMYKYYQNIDILLFLTRRKAESLGLVSLEAMACGVPVVATPNFAIPEYVIPGVSGELFQDNDADAMLKALETCITDPGKYNSRQVILDKYSRAATIEGYKEFFGTK